MVAGGEEEKEEEGEEDKEEEGEGKEEKEEEGGVRGSTSTTTRFWRKVGPNAFKYAYAKKKRNNKTKQRV